MTVVTDVMSLAMVTDPIALAMVTDPIALARVTDALANEESNQPFVTNGIVSDRAAAEIMTSTEAGLGSVTIAKAMGSVTIAKDMASVTTVTVVPLLVDGTSRIPEEFERS